MEIDWKMVLGGAGVALVLGFILINFVSSSAYDFSSCTYNKFGCELNATGWDGICTSNVTDTCCEETINVRMCDGQETWNPDDCRQYYCTTEGECCYGEYNIAGMYVCTCKDVADLPL